MIFRIENIREIYEIITNYQCLTSRINESLHLLKINKASKVILKLTLKKLNN